MAMHKRPSGIVFSAALLVLGVVPFSVTEAQECTADIHLFTADAAPASGTVEVYINYGSGDVRQPEGQLVDRIAVATGQQLDIILDGYPCGVNARAWFTPVGGEPILLTSQFYPGEFGLGAEGTDTPFAYDTAFGGEEASTVAPSVASDAIVALGEGKLIEADIDGITEWGYWMPGGEFGEYVVLGWSWYDKDMLLICTVPANGPLTEAELCAIVNHELNN